MPKLTAAQSRALQMLADGLDYDLYVASIHWKTRAALLRQGLVLVGTRAVRLSSQGRKALASI